MMTSAEFLKDVREKHGEQMTRDGRTINEIPDDELLKKMLERYPGERENIVDLPEADVPEVPKTPVQEKLDTAKKGLISRLGDRFTQRVDTASNEILEEQNPIRKGLRVLGQGAGFVGDIVGEGIKEIPGAEKALEVASSPKVQSAIEAALPIAKAARVVRENVAEPLAQEFPEAAQDVKDVVGVASLLPAGKLAGATAKTVAKAPEAVEGALAARTVSKGQKVAEAERDAIQQMIAPGLNKKEVQRAMEEGRITRGEQGFWLGKKPDIVDVDQKVKQITETVQRRIPDAANLDDVGLSMRAKREIEDIASNLEPKMREVKLRDVTPSETPIAKAAKQFKTEDEFVQAFTRGELDADTVRRIQEQYGDAVFDDVDAIRDLYRRAQTPSMIEEAFGAWNALKKRQANEPEFLDFPSNKAFQDKFENYIGQLRKGSEEKTLADLWKIRKDYDASIPEGVKQANDMSPVQRQVQKEMWLQNRRIMNDLINDTSRGLGKESSEAFKDMSDLYSVRENIMGKAKLDTKGEPGFLQKTGEFIKGGAQNAVPFGAGALIF